MSRPFQYLQQNIDKINFDCDPKYIHEYKRAFSAVLTKMDKFFVQNGLYEVVDYQPIVESMFASHKTFSFKIDDKFSKRYWAGVHVRKPQGVREIGMSKEYMGRGTITEGVLCHEFIHYLTLGPEVLKYTKDGDKYEVRLPVSTGLGRIGGTIINTTKKTVDGLDAGLALDGGFICEAFTELVKQEIYTEEECPHSYPAQTSLIKLLNNLTGTKVNVKDFLRGDLPNYVKILGRKNFEEFNSLCEAFQKKYNANAHIDHTTDSDYLAAQDLVCRTILKNIEKEPKKYTPEDYIRIASCIMAEVPALSSDPNYTEIYKSAITTAGNAIIHSQSLKNDDRRKFEKLLNATLTKSIQQKKKIFNIPAPYVDFAFKKTPEGFALNFKNGPFIPSSLFPTLYSCKKVAKIGANEISIEVDEKGIYKITAKTPDTEPQVIKILPNKSNPNDLLIQDANNKDIVDLNFTLESKKLNKSIQENLYLLENLKQYDNIQTIPKANAVDTVIAHIKNPTLYSKTKEDMTTPTSTTTPHTSKALDRELSHRDLEAER